MPATTATARDEILGRLKSVVDGLTSPPGPLKVIWDDKKDQPPRANPTESWARALVQHTTGRQASLSGATGRKRWERGGFLIVQLFTPALEGQNLADELGSIIRGAFEGYSTPSGVWFRNPRINEVGQDGAWLQTNIFVDFLYDEVK